MDPTIISLIVVAVVTVLVVASGLRTIADHHRGVVMRLGRRGLLLGPGLHWVLPLGIDRVVRVDMRSTVLSLPRQEVLTADGVPLQVTAAMHMQVVNPVLAATRVADRQASAQQLGQAALRDVASRTSLRDLLTELGTVRRALDGFVGDRAHAWGIAITAIDLIDVDLPESMRRAMAVALERAVDTPAGKQGPPGTLVAAARALAQQPPEARQHYLETLADLQHEGAGIVVVVPLPVDLVPPFTELQGRAARAGGTPAAAPPVEPILPPADATPAGEDGADEGAAG